MAMKRRPPLDDLLLKACGVAGCAVDEVQTPRSRKREVVYARELYATSARVCGYTYPEAQRAAQMSSHSTLVTACQRLRARMDDEAAAALRRITGDYRATVAEADYRVRRSPNRATRHGSPPMKLPAIHSKLTGDMSQAFMASNPKVTEADHWTSTRGKSPTGITTTPGTVDGISHATPWGGVWLSTCAASDTTWSASHLLRRAVARLATGGTRKTANRSGVSRD